MLRALILGLRQLADPAAQRLLLRCVLLTLATFIALVGAVAALLFGLDLTGLSWLDPVLATAGSALALVLAWLLFPIVVVLTLGLFAEEVVAAVERRHYPELPRAPGMSVAAQAYSGIRLVMLGLLLNLIALPFYFVPGANLPVYLALNGYLLGREYFELVAGQRLPMREVARLRREQRGRLWLAGVAIAVMLVIPVFNLVAPVVAIAFMVHLMTPLVRRAAAARPSEAVGQPGMNSTPERWKHLTSPEAVVYSTFGKIWSRLQVIYLSSLADHGSSRQLGVASPCSARKAPRSTPREAVRVRFTGPPVRPPCRRRRCAAEASWRPGRQARRPVRLWAAQPR